MYARHNDDPKATKRKVIIEKGLIIVYVCIYARAPAACTRELNQITVKMLGKCLESQQNNVNKYKKVALQKVEYKMFKKYGECC